jgi:hypothetical protein
LTPDLTERRRLQVRRRGLCLVVLVVVSIVFLAYNHVLRFCQNSHLSRSLSGDVFTGRLAELHDIPLSQHIIEDYDSRLAHLERIILPFSHLTESRLTELEKTFSGELRVIKDHASRLSHMENVVLQLRSSLLVELESSDVVDRLMQRILLQISKDLLGKRDFALRSAGGRVILKITTPPALQSNWLSSLWHRRHSVIPYAPEAAIIDDLHMDSCWRISGGSGQLGISLSEPILVTHVTIDHLSKDMTSDIQLAPRRMVLWGVIDGTDNTVKARQHFSGMPNNGPLISGGYSYVQLRVLEYDIHAPIHLQTFAIAEDVRALGMDFGVVVLEILNNWGGSDTCLYRVRIHGKHLSDTITPEAEAR